MRLSSVYYADKDPWLESDAKSADILHLTDPTPTRASLAHGHYWIVLEHDGNRKQQRIIVTGPMVVKVDF